MSPDHGLDEEMPGRTDGTWSHTATRRLRWGDADRHGRLRLDATARYLQDVANDDTRAAGFDPGAPWVVRRTRIHVLAPPRLGEVLSLTTFAGALGSRWAERRTTITGEAGGHVEATSLWVHVDPASGRPARLTPEFLARYEPAAAGRTVGSRLRHPPPPAVGEGDGVQRRPWPLRSVDHDRLGHVNNAATWAPVEDELDRLGLVPVRAELEHRDAIEPADEVVLATTVDEGLVRVWLTVEGAVRASAAVATASGPSGGR